MHRPVAGHPELKDGPGGSLCVRPGTGRLLFLTRHRQLDVGPVAVARGKHPGVLGSLQVGDRLSASADLDADGIPHIGQDVLAVIPNRIVHRKALRISNPLMRYLLCVPGHEVVLRQGDVDHQAAVGIGVVSGICDASCNYTIIQRQASPLFLLLRAGRTGRQQSYAAQA